MQLLIVGSYGFANTGDEAILAGMVHLLRLYIPGVAITVLSGDPEQTGREHGVAAIHWRDLSGVFGAVESADLVICGGGGLFFDYWGCAPEALWTPDHWGLSYVAGAPLLARLMGKPTAVYAVGVGPLRTAEGRAMTRAVMQAASAISVRDAGSLELLVELGVERERIALTADPAFAWNETEPHEDRPAGPVHARGRGGPVVGVCLRQWDIGVDPGTWEAAVAEGVDRFLHATGGQAVFIPFQWMEGNRPENDEVVTTRILEQMPHRSDATVLPGPLSYRDKINALMGCDVVLGMRLHSIIFAMLAGVPFVALDYDPKVSHLAARAGQQETLLSLGGLTPTAVSEALMRSWHDHLRIGACLRQEAENLRALAHQDARQVASLLEGPPRVGLAGDDYLLLIFRALWSRLVPHAGSRPQRPSGEYYPTSRSTDARDAQAAAREAALELEERDRRLAVQDSTIRELSDAARTVEKELASVLTSRRYVVASAVADAWWLFRHGDVGAALRGLHAGIRTPPRSYGPDRPTAAPPQPAPPPPRDFPPDRGKEETPLMPAARPTESKGLVNVLTPLFFDADGVHMMSGGAERYLLELAPIIRSMGYDVRVYQSARGDWTRRYDGIEVVGLDTGGVDGRLNEAFHTRVGSEVLTLYHAFYLAAPLCVPGSIGISHGVNWDNPEFQYPREGFLNGVEQFLNAISNLACVVSVDTNTINWVRATNSSLARRFVYIPNFVDTKKFRPSGKRRTPAGPVTVLYPRRLYAPRGFWTVADMLPDLLAAYPQLMFRFVGPANSPREAAAMRAFTEAYPGRFRWTVLPPERMPEAYQAADITVIPTLYAEGTSLSCLEALASGNAVIATNVGGLPNLILDGYNGLLIDPTPQALREALDRLIREPDLCRELARRGTEVAQHYHLDLWKERWRALLEEHLSRPRVVVSAEAPEAPPHETTPPEP